MAQLVCILFMLFSLPVHAENYLLNGGQESIIHYTMTQEVQPSANTRKLLLNYVIPQSFDSPTYRQKIERFQLDFSPAPDHRAQHTDKRGNTVVEASWKSPRQTVATTIRLTAANRVALEPIQTTAAFPPAGLSADLAAYLQNTAQVDSTNPKIQAKAKALTANAATQFDAVQMILTWVVDHLHYIVNPKQYDALYTFETGKGNCQNYSHLAAALMRAVGIPVRIVNGVTLKQPYNIRTGDSILTMKMAQTRHSWIEVYFPDLHWVPFDPQGSELFVSNRFIRVEVGIDNRETENDGLMRWTRLKGTTGRPILRESIEADFTTDQVEIAASKTDYGPRGLLLSPRVEATFAKVQPKPAPPPPAKIEKKILRKLVYSNPFVFGNLDFPENLDFLSARADLEEGAGGMMTARKNFIAETAEYVTTQGQQYAQTFILNQPVELEKIGLALHKFSDNGQIWIELYEDKAGMPGRSIATSDFISPGDIPFRPGYQWVDFRFPGQKIRLSPGRYWAALGFSGKPIVNWFYSYGKPVGPQDGTRYKTIFNKTWSRSLSFEFNYRVVGLAAVYQ